MFSSEEEEEEEEEQNDGCVRISVLVLEIKIDFLFLWSCGKCFTLYTKKTKQMWKSKESDWLLKSDASCSCSQTLLTQRFLNLDRRKIRIFIRIKIIKFKCFSLKTRTRKFTRLMWCWCKRYHQTGAENKLIIFIQQKKIVPRVRHLVVEPKSSVMLINYNVDNSEAELN